MDEQKKLLQKFREGSLTPRETEQFETFIQGGLIEPDDLDIFPRVMDKLGSERLSFPAHSSDARFYAMLEREKQHKPKRFSLLGLAPRAWASALAMSVVLFSAGWYLGDRGEASSPINQSLTSRIISEQDLGRKIEFVARAGEMAATDETIIKTLLFVLTQDNSNNVRLAALEALQPYLGLPEVRTGLLSAISAQDSPLVLNGLIEAVVLGGTSLDKEEILMLIKPDLPVALRDKLTATIVTL